MSLKSWSYKPLAKTDVEDTDMIDDTSSLSLRYKCRRQRQCLRGIIVSGSLALLVAILYVSYNMLRQQEISSGVESEISVPETQPFDHSKYCHRPSLRKEWRTLEYAEQAAYISAVKCLMNHPSIFRAGTSFYDDFIFAHSKTGSYSHYAAAFLPWHRMYMHVYEQALRKKCEYNGAFPYWDWTLDAKDLSVSPIWNSTYGFGGNGDMKSPEILYDGHCVVDGPFSNTTRAWKALSKGHSHDVIYWPHCLSRGFASATGSTGELKALHHLISPEFVEKTLEQPDYESFFKEFESGAHNAIPQFLKGDWLTFTAPNDPVFFLHHTQVDRLWWMWQMRDPGARLKQFQGPKEDFRHKEADHSESSKTDVLPIAGLAEDKMVEDVMNTTNGYLCYTY